MDVKEFTVRDLINAIKQNGIPWTQSTFFRTANTQAGWLWAENVKREGKVIESACLVGVAAINLGVEPSDIAIGVWDEDLDDSIDLIEEIISYNDNIATSWEDAARYAISYLEPYVDTRFSATLFDYKGMVNRIEKPVIIDNQLELFGPA